MIEEGTLSYAGLRIKRAVVGLASLDELPGLLARALRALRQQRSDLVPIVEASPSLTAGLLSLARQEGIDPEDLNFSIGPLLERIQSHRLLLWLLSIRPYRSSDRPLTVEREQLLLHSVAVAHAARRLAQACPEGPSPDLAYVAGLVHDLGKLAFEQVMPKGFEAVMQAAARTGAAVHVVERGRIGADHATIGRLVAEAWGLPAQIQEAIWLHHCPAACGPARVLAKVVAVADCLARAAAVGQSGSHDRPEPYPHMAQWLQVEPDLLDAVEGHLHAIAPTLTRLIVDRAIDPWYALAQESRVEARDLAAALGQQQSDRTRLEALTSQIRLVEAIMEAVHEGRRTRDLALRLARIWQHYYQTGRACVLWCVPAAEGVVEMAFAEALGCGTQVMIPDAELAGLIRGCSLEQFDLYEGHRFVEALSGQIDTAWDANRTHWVPLAFGHEALGVLLFEINYPIALERIRDGLQLAAQLAGASLYLTSWADHIQGQAEDLAGILSAQALGPDLAGGIDLYEALAEVASGLAHELNNPLAVISARAQLLSASTGDQQVHKALQQIQQQTQQVAALVEGLMSYAEPTVPRKMATPCRMLLEEAMALARQRLGLESLDAAVEFEGEVPDLDIDSAQVASALANVLVNAFQSFGEPGGRVVIGLRAEGPVAKVKVVDHGCGMDGRTMARATLPFFSFRPAGRQTGLGLAFAHRLITLNGGRMDLRSRPGAGTTVEIQLPLLGPVGPENPR